MTTPFDYDAKLDHLSQPTLAAAEAHRVLAAGGTLVAATASHHDSPELAAVWRLPPVSFDAEDGPGLVASDAAAAAGRVATPVTITKRGALLYASR